MCLKAFCHFQLNLPKVHCWQPVIMINVMKQAVNETYALCKPNKFPGQPLFCEIPSESYIFWGPLLRSLRMHTHSLFFEILTISQIKLSVHWHANWKSCFSSNCLTLSLIMESHKVSLQASTKVRSSMRNDTELASVHFTPHKLIAAKPALWLLHWLGRSLLDKSSRQQSGSFSLKYSTFLSCKKVAMPFVIVSH